ncbi:MAG: LON peptidase substrate-binding domain-containing protein [Longimicrobiales bacterium]
MPRLRYRLPLFPLPVVLLPGAVMPLHIFEQRYRDMVADVLEQDRRFGLIFHDWDDHGPFLAESGQVGCVAEVREHEQLEDGRYVLIVEGLERFVIDEGLEQQALYFEAIVTPYADTSAMHGEEMEFRRRESIRLFEQLVGLLPERPDRLPELSAEAEVSYPLAQTIQMELPWHQRLLEIQDEGSRLERIDQVLRAVIRRGQS